MVDDDDDDTVPVLPGNIVAVVAVDAASVTGLVDRSVYLDVEEVVGADVDETANWVVGRYDDAEDGKLLAVG